MLIIECSEFFTSLYIQYIFQSLRAFANTPETSQRYNNEDIKNIHYTRVLAYPDVVRIPSKDLE